MIFKKENFVLDSLSVLYTVIRFDGKLMYILLEEFCYLLLC